jgi:hypothetical protein
MRFMASELRANRAPSNVMAFLAIRSSEPIEARLRRSGSGGAS